MTEYSQDPSNSNFEDYYETTDKVNVRFNMNIQSIYENNTLFSQPCENQKQSLQIQPFIQFKKSGLLKIYFKIIDFSNPSNTTIINTELEMTTNKASNEGSLSNSDCFLRDVTTGSQSIEEEEESSHFERAKHYSGLEGNFQSNLNGIYNQQYSSNQFHYSGKDSSFQRSGSSSFKLHQQNKAGLNTNAKRVKKNEEKYLQKQKTREESGLNCSFEDETDLNDARQVEKEKSQRNQENPYKLRKTELEEHQQQQLQQHMKEDYNRHLIMNQQETSQSDILFNLYPGHLSQQHSPQTNSFNYSSRSSKNEMNAEQDHISCLAALQGETSQLLSESLRLKSPNTLSTKFGGLDSNFAHHCADNSNNDYQDLSYSNKSLDQTCVDSSTVITRTRRNVSSTPQCLTQLPLLSELPNKKKPSTINIASQECAAKEDSNSNACKGNAVNMAKNILKGFMEYVFVSAKEEDLIECCITTRGISSSTAENISNENDQKLPIKDNEANSAEDINANEVEQKQENQDEDNEEGDKMDDEDQKDGFLPDEEGAKDQKSMIDGIRKRFKKQYNSKMLEKPSNSKLLKLFSNNNYGKLFKHYFNSQEILNYIESSNIQNKNTHKELVEKIRYTQFDIEKLQDVLKTRIFKRPPFQKPQK